MDILDKPEDNFKHQMREKRSSGVRGSTSQEGFLLDTHGGGPVQTPVGPRVLGHPTSGRGRRNREGDCERRWKQNLKGGTFDSDKGHRDSGKGATGHASPMVASATDPWPGTRPGHDARLSLRPSGLSRSWPTFPTSSESNGCPADENDVSLAPGPERAGVSTRGGPLTGSGRAGLDVWRTSSKAATGPVPDGEGCRREDRCRRRVASEGVPRGRWGWCYVATPDAASVLRATAHKRDRTRESTAGKTTRTVTVFPVSVRLYERSCSVFVFATNGREVSLPVLPKSQEWR